MAGPTADTLNQRPLTRRVFISSTSLDLERHRERVRDVLLRLGLFPVAMESFGAQGRGTATSVSIGGVDSCDCYLGLVAWRYGHVPAGQVSSVTEQEYDEAVRLGLPRYIFLADPATTADEGADALFPVSTRDTDAEREAALQAFRARLERENVRDYFTTPEDLAMRVSTALASYVVQVRAAEQVLGPRPPHDLPPRAPEFVGRERELTELEAALRRGQSTGLSAAVAGMGGVGKSALAAEAFARLANAQPPAFPGGVTWVRCDGRRGLEGLAWMLDQLLAAWGATLPPEVAARVASAAAAGDLEEAVRLHARALGARLRVATPPGSEPALVTAAAPAPALVLLDNVEYDLPLAEALEILAPLGITVLVTARHQPRVGGLRLVELEVLDPDAALRLFEERYSDRGGAWELERDAPPARETVELLGRLPLAIELAAARTALAHTGVAALAEQLRAVDRLGQLRLPGEDTRTTSVRYALSQSLTVLSDAQRMRFAALGLPSGPDCPRPTIETLLAAVPPAATTPESGSDAAARTDAGSASDDLDLLSALSLATQLPPETPGVPAPRVRLHPLLRDLAREEWAHQPAATQQAGLAALLVAVGDIVHHHRRDFATLAREEELIAGTLNHAAREHVEPHQLAATMVDFWGYLEIGGHWRLGTELVKLQGQAYREVGNRAGEGTVLGSLGVLARDQGRPAEAAHYYEQALVILREVGNRAGEGTVLGNLGILARDQGRPAEAAHYYEQALVILREVGDRAGEGAVLGNLGILASVQGQLAEAAHYNEQALAIAREVGDRAGEGTVLGNLGVLAREQGRPAEAAHYYEQALVILREVGDRAGEGAVLYNLGLLARSQQHMENARRYFKQAVATYDVIGAKANAANARALLEELEPARTRTRHRWWPFGR